MLKISEEVFVSEESIVKIGPEEISFLKKRASASPRKRARICAHRDNGDSLHEMLIAISCDSYIHPHKHLGKSESFHIIEGEVNIAIFDDMGDIREVVEMGPPGSGRCFFYRISEPLFHTLNIRSDVLVVHETTNGPFDKTQSVLAPFAPQESDAEASRKYAEKVAESVRVFLESRHQREAHRHG